MDEKKILTAAEITQEMITSALAPWRSALENAQSAFQAYWDDVERRKAALDEQAQGYLSEINNFAAKRKNLAPKINYLASKGQIEEAAAVELELVNIDKSIADLQRKLKLISAAELHGDKQLYHAAETAYQAAIDQGKKYDDYLNELAKIVNEERSRLFALSNRIGNMGGNFQESWGPAHDAKKAHDKLNNHYYRVG